MKKPRNPKPRKKFSPPFSARQGMIGCGMLALLCTLMRWLNLSLILRLVAYVVENYSQNELLTALMQSLANVNTWYTVLSLVLKLLPIALQVAFLVAVLQQKPSAPKRARVAGLCTALFALVTILLFITTALPFVFEYGIILSIFPWLCVPLGILEIICSFRTSNKEVFPYGKKET